MDLSIILHQLHFFTSCNILSHGTASCSGKRMETSMSNWTASEIERQDGKRVFITGGFSGIGFQTARIFGSKGAQVTFLGRDAEKGERALLELRRMVPGGDFAMEQIDLASLSSIAACAGRILEKGRGIDLLLRKAGRLLMSKCPSPHWIPTC